jgi:hypothetical protein
MLKASSKSSALMFDLRHKTTKKKGKTDEKASFDRIGGKWIGIHYHAAF